MSNKARINYETANSLRGFLIDTFNIINAHSKMVHIRINHNAYEKVSVKRKILHRLISLNIFDILGVFQIVKYDSKDRKIDRAISYNRFLDSNKPYYIILENPYALVHYSDRRMNYTVGKKKLEKRFSDPSLLGIICMCKACKDTIGKVYSLPKKLDIYEAYPLISNVDYAKKDEKNINCLFVASEFWLKGGRELLEICRIIKGREPKLKISFTVITPLDRLDKGTIRYMNRMGVELVDYKLSKKELNKRYKKAHIILGPTKMESFPMTILESMKYGCVYIGTSPYAVSEMVKDCLNGYTFNSIYSPWRSDNTFDHKKHKKLNKLKKRVEIDKDLTNFIVDKILFLEKNKKQLANMCKQSYLRANKGEFSEDILFKEWDRILTKEPKK